MPEHASRFAAALYDQFEEESRVADWGGDELFTRMPRPRAVDDAPPPRFLPSRPAAERPLALVDSPEDRRRAPGGERSSSPRDRRRVPSAEAALQERADRLGLSVVADGSGAQATGLTEAHRAARALAERSPGPPEADSAHALVAPGDDPAERVRPGMGEGDPAGRHTKVITGRPDGAPRPLRSTAVDRQRPPRSPAEWVGARPERIVGWAFALGLLLILIAISTADAATV